MASTDRIFIALAGAAGILALAAGWLLLAPPEGAADAALLAPIASSHPTAPVHDLAASPTPAEIVVDVEGGVLRPGIQRLRAGARVADAIAAAGGDGAQADLLAAAAQLNLAQPLGDGEQVYVPLAGSTSAGGAAGTPTTAGASGGLVNLNTASPEELDALPGIGPVTVQKIVAARDERPFASLEDAVERGALNRGQVDKIRDLATAE